MTALRTRFNLFHILLVRWISLVLTLILFLQGVDIGPIQYFVAVCLYCWLLTHFWQKVSQAIKRWPQLIFIDVTIAAFLYMTTSSYWVSPYFVYMYACHINISSLLGWRYGFSAVLYTSALSAIGLLIDKQSLAEIAGYGGYGLLANSYLGLFFGALIYGYPAQITRRIKKTETDIDLYNAKLEAAEELLNSVEFKQQTELILLTARERQILACLAQGWTNSQIANKLYISELTVKSHLFRVYKKLGVSSREEATIYYHNN